MAKFAVRTFLYFSYGSNMSTFQIRLQNIKAKFVSIARLDNYRLDFIRYSKFWGGPTATIVPTANAHVWGVVWRVDVTDMATLDKQKDVDTKKYYVKYVEVFTPHMGAFMCRTYIQKVNPLPRASNDDVPVERWPSQTYKNILTQGALQHHLPDYYIENLKQLKNNGEEGCFKMTYLLKLFEQNDPCKCQLPQKKLSNNILDLRKMRC